LPLFFDLVKNKQGKQTPNILQQLEYYISLIVASVELSLELGSEDSGVLSSITSSFLIK
jgi:hypothetical protein